jgi:thiol-disulfide isomerase/thioredoxin
MTRAAHFARALAALLCALAFASLAATPIDKPAPPYSFALLDGSRLASKDTAGQVVVVNFWATWCAPCRAELPLFDAYLRKHRDEGLRVVAVCLDDPLDRPKVQAAMKNYVLATALREGSDFAGFDPILPLPKTFVIDRKGVVRKAGWTAEPFIDEKALEAVVTPLLAGGR